MNNGQTNNTPAQPIKKAPKIPEAEILLNKQLDRAKTNRKSDIGILAVFITIVLSFGILFWVMPDSDYSGSERRNLQQVPVITLKRVLDDTKRDLKEMTMTDEEKKAQTVKTPVFADEIAKYYADQFPFRNQLRVLKGICELCLFKQENNGVIVTTDGYLVAKDTIESTDGSRTYKESVETIKKNVSYLAAIQHFLKDSDIDFQFAVAGRCVDVMKGSLPGFFDYSETHSDLYWETYNATLAEKGLTAVELKDMLRAKAENGEYVSYKTDHHWTTLGAYYAYCEIMKAYGVEPAPLDTFTPEHFSTEFHGTTYATAGITTGGADTIDFYRFEGDKDYTMTVMPGTAEEKAFEGFYDYSYQNDADKYSGFLSGNNAVTTITKNNPETEREKLILIKDSFGHSLAPFLAYNYDLIVIDLRSYNGDMKEFLSDSAVTRMLVTYNMATFCNDTNLGKAVTSVSGYFNTEE